MNPPGLLVGSNGSPLPQPWILTWISPVVGVLLIISPFEAVTSLKVRTASGFNLSYHNMTRAVPFLELTKQNKTK